MSSLIRLGQRQFGNVLSVSSKTLKNTSKGMPRTIFRTFSTASVTNSGGTAENIVNKPVSESSSLLPPPTFEEKQNMSIRGALDGSRPIYFDMQATTPLDPRVLDAMMPFLTEKFGNPHSRTHTYGWEAEDAVEDARAEVAKLIHCDPKEIIFTSGATESNNLALKGIARFHRNQGNHIITSAIEHKCVLDSCRALELEGFRVTYLPVNNEGLVDLDALSAAICPETILVSIMAANNEIGTVQPLKRIAKIIRDRTAELNLGKRRIYFHTDAAQMLGKMDIDVGDMDIDLMSLSSHKVYGPKGIGALYIRKKPKVRLEAIISGGGQERGLRSGTLAPFLAVGFGEACRLYRVEGEAERARLAALSRRLVEGITSKLDQVVINGPAAPFKGDGTAEENRILGNVNMSFAFVEGESLLLSLKGLAVSSGSACTSASLEPSYVLRAIGVEDELAHTSIRFGLGRFTTEADVDYAIDLVVKNVNKLRELSPLWEMYQEGIDLKSIKWSQDH